MSAIFLPPVCLTHWRTKYTSRVDPTSVIPIKFEFDMTIHCRVVAFLSADTARDLGALTFDHLTLNSCHTWRDPWVEGQKRLHYITNVGNYTNFGDHRLRGFWVSGGQISPFPIDFHSRPYNTFALPCDCVIWKEIFESLLFVVWPTMSWLVEKPSRDVEHYRMFTASRSTVDHYNDQR